MHCPADVQTGNQEYLHPLNQLDLPSLQVAGKLNPV